MLSEENLSLFLRCDWDLLWDKTCQRVDNRAISDLAIVLAIGLEPLITVNFQDGFHQELWPDFIAVGGSGKNWLTLGTAWHSIIDFYESFFAHKSELDPIFACWRLNRDPIFLRINSLPN